MQGAIHKMNMKKNILTMLLLLMVISGLSCAMVQNIAAEEVSENESLVTNIIDGTNVSWSYNPDWHILEFTGNGAIPSYNFTGEGDDYVHITPWIEYADETLQIIIGDGITEIGDYCFPEFDIVMSITIADSVISIGEKTFPEIENSESITIKGSQLSEAELVAYENAYGFEPVEKIGRGDMNSDGIINAEDALFILKISAQLEDAYKYTADANEDGKTTSRDALYVLKHTAKLLASEEIEIYGADSNAAKIGSGSYDIAELTYLRSYKEYVDYINGITEQYPDAFGGNVDEILAWYNVPRLDSTYDLIALYVENSNWDNTKYTVDSLTTDGLTYQVNIDSYVPVGSIEGSSGWCVFVEVMKCDEIYGILGASVTEEVEIMAEPLDEKGTWSKLDASEFSEGVDVITDYDTYSAFISKYFNEQEAEYMDICSEEFFADNVLIAARYEAPYMDYYDVIPEKITKINGKYRIYVDRLSPDINLCMVGYWVSFIPTSIKEWSECGFEFDGRSYKVSGMADNMDEAESCTYKLEKTSVSDIMIISTYQEFVEYRSKISVLVETIDDSYPNGYSEEFFEENSLIVAKYMEYRSSMIDIIYSGMEEKEGVCTIKLAACMPDSPTTDDSGLWGVMIPVEGKEWSNKSYIVEAIDMEVVVE